jgi:hypothetical protein
VLFFDLGESAPPPKTSAFWQIVDVNSAPEDAELMDLLDKLGCPAAVTIVNLIEKAGGDVAEWLLDRPRLAASARTLRLCIGP